MKCLDHVPPPALRIFNRYQKSDPWVNFQQMLDLTSIVVHASRDMSARCAPAEPQHLSGHYANALQSWKANRERGSG